MRVREGEGRHTLTACAPSLLHLWLHFFCPFLVVVLAHHPAFEMILQHLLHCTVTLPGAASLADASLLSSVSVKKKGEEVRRYVHTVKKRKMVDPFSDSLFF